MNSVYGGALPVLFARKWKQDGELSRDGRSHGDGTSGRSFLAGTSGYSTISPSQSRGKTPRVNEQLIRSGEIVAPSGDSSLFLVISISHAASNSVPLSDLCIRVHYGREKLSSANRHDNILQSIRMNEGMLLNRLVTVV